MIVIQRDFLFLSLPLIIAASALPAGLQCNVDLCSIQTDNFNSPPEPKMLPDATITSCGAVWVQVS